MLALSHSSAHARYGLTYATALHPNWSEANPIHLVGHSLGALTALEFYQLVSADFFGVGSNYKWIRSITSIAGPLTGSTLANMAGLDGVTMPRGSPAHILYIILGIWGKTYNALPWLRGAYDLRMDQWVHLSLRQLCSVNGPVNQSMDSGFFSILPSRRVHLNAQLQHMDKLHLMSIVTSPKTCHVPITEVSTLAALLLVLYNKFPSWLPLVRKLQRVRSVVGFALALALWRQVARLDIAKLPSLYGLKWLMRRTAKALPQIFDGYESHHWEHNDGAVNIRSQLRPWFPSASATKAQVLSTATATDHIDPHTRTLPASLSSAAPVNLAGGHGATDHSAAAAGTTANSLVRCDSHISIDDFHREHEDSERALEAQREEDEAAAASERFVKGRWYVYRVNSNHFTGTYWDREAGNLYKSLFAQIANEYEATEAQGDGGKEEEETAPTGAKACADSSGSQQCSASASAAFAA